jgi:hypothetical protein
MRTFTILLLGAGLMFGHGAGHLRMARVHSVHVKRIKQPKAKRPHKRRVHSLKRPQL